MRNETQSLRQKFKYWLSDNYQNVLENYKIAPLSGNFKPDIALRYETLHMDILRIKQLPREFLKNFKYLKATGGFRPPRSKNPKHFF